MQEDPYRGDGLNLYVYCHNNPVMYYDPSGYMGMCSDAKYAELNDDTLVVRGGQSSSENLLTNQENDPRGHISANSAAVSKDVLATTPQPFLNGQISVTTVGEIRNIGMDVIPDPTNSNPYHASIVPQNTPMTSTEAQGLSNLFQREKNTWKK